MSDIKHTKESLAGLSRKKLQALAKNLGIKANQKSTEIINEVLELQNAEESEDDESQDEPPATNKEDSKETHCRTTSHSLHPVNPLPLRGGRYGHSLPQGGVLSSQQHLVEMASNSRNRSSACGGTPEHLSSPHLAHQSPRYENTSPKLEDSPQYTRRTQNQARSPQSPAFSPSSPLAQPASLPRNQQEREYSPVIEAAPTRFRPQDATAGTTFTSNIAARREAARPAQLVAESPRTTDPAAPATPSSSPKETKPVHHTPKAGPSNSNQEITPPSYSPRVYPSGWGKKQGNEGSGNAMSLSPPAKPQTPKELSERRNRFERQSSVHHFPDSDPPVSPIGVIRTPSPQVGPGIGDPYSPYGTVQVADPYGGVDPYYEHEPPAIRYGGITAISSISQHRPQTPQPRGRSNPQTPRTDSSLYNPGPLKEPTPQQETVFQLPGSDETWDSIHHGPREANHVYRAPGSPMQERASRRQSSAPSARTLVEAHVEEEEVDENAHGASSDSNKENAQPVYDPFNDTTVHYGEGYYDPATPDEECRRRRRAFRTVEESEGAEKAWVDEEDFVGEDAKLEEEHSRTTGEALDHVEVQAAVELSQSQGPQSRVPPTPSSLADYEDDEETAGVYNAPASVHDIQRFHMGVAGVLSENVGIRETVRRQYLVLERIRERIGSIRDEVKRETGWQFGVLHNTENRPLSAEERRLNEQRARQQTGQENMARIQAQRRAPLVQPQNGQPIAPNENGPRGMKRTRDEEEDEATQAAILESFKTKKAREQEPEHVEHGDGWTQEEETQEEETQEEETQEEEDDFYA
ncbi:hypothetical protein D9611_004008 [Ephemerocybe angulata]|uniref:Uncharacterized protein n=1 Tax=Ephemerocybe angulata TaxID=980116 RepID=A0A8H5B5Y1_9AGAR|nr:hypothetical protein D9611_004008 [Tulosesus angulatus]